MYRVLRPGGRLLLLGHIASRYPPVRLAQFAVQRYSQRITEDRQLRRTLPLVEAAGFRVDHRTLRRAGIIELLAASKQTPTGQLVLIRQRRPRVRLVARFAAATRSTVPIFSRCDPVISNPVVLTRDRGRRVGYSPDRAVNTSTSRWSAHTGHHRLPMWSSS